MSCELYKARKSIKERRAGNPKLTDLCCSRNEKLVQRGLPLPTAVKTGTTIAGVVFKDGVILGADTRATAGPVIADKKCLKLHYMQPNIYCAGAGETHGFFANKFF